MGRTSTTNILKPVINVCEFVCTCIHGYVFVPGERVYASVSVS